jgi:hypothetical protein
MTCCKGKKWCIDCKTKHWETLPVKCPYCRAVLKERQSTGAYIFPPNQSRLGWGYALPVVALSYQDISIAISIVPNILDNDVG